MNPSNELDAGKKWHLDRRVPIAIIVAIFIQSMAAVWWASDVNSRVVSIERWVITRPDQLDSDINKRVAILENTLIHIRENLNEIKKLLQDRRQSDNRIAR